MFGLAARRPSPSRSRPRECVTRTPPACPPRRRLVSMPPWSKVSGQGGWSWRAGVSRRGVGESGGGVGVGLLAFTSSPRIPKFFSNLQLLDVEANHQRGSPCADSPRRPLLPRISSHLWSAVSFRPPHLFMSLFIISSAVSESEREEASTCENGH